jgi:mono/diheme cytochrome c family protein
MHNSLMSNIGTIEVAGATCAGCHGANGIGTPVGPNLTSGKWLWGDGSLKSITDTVKNGVPKPKQHFGAMPPSGGISLSDSDPAAVAAYVWAIGQQKKGQLGPNVCFWH